MIESDCFVLFADRVQDDASTIVIGEFSLITALDADALSTSIAGILESVEQDAEGGWSRTAAIDVLGSGDEEATRELAELLPDAEFRERSIIVEALASSEQGRAELIELIRARELSERELERIAQVIRQRGIATDFVFEALRTANPEVIDSLLAFLVGSIPPQDAPQLLPWAGHPTPASVLAPLDDSPDVAEGLGRAPPSALGAYLNALDGRPGHDSDILRAILIIAKREGAAERSLALPNFASSQIESTLDNRNGTVVRLALAVAGYLQLESLLDKIIDFARSDPHPEIRSAAVSSLQYLSELDADAANTAVQALFDDYPNVRMAAADTLKQLSLTDEQVGELGIALEEESWPEVRTRMMSALASQASRAASIRLIQYLEVAPGREVRQAMIAVQNREQGLPGSFLVELFEAHEGDLRTQISVVRTMSSAEGDVASEFLQRLALNEDASLRLRQAAIESLGRNRQIAAVAEMILLLDHEIARLRRSAARALAYFPDVRIERTLRRHLESEENPQVRNALAASLRAVIQGRSIRDRTEGLTEPDRESLPPRLD
jgi:HEAT repeat protein